MKANEVNFLIKNFLSTIVAAADQLLDNRLINKRGRITQARITSFRNFTKDATSHLNKVDKWKIQLSLDTTSFFQSS